jgi:hypothetical protein
LVHVEYPMPVAMRTVKEWMSELNRLPHLFINHMQRTRGLIGSHVIEVVMLRHEAVNRFVTSFNALGAKVIWEQRQDLQADKTVPDADPLLASRKDPHEQVILDTVKLLIWSRESGPLLGPGVGLQTVQILDPPHKERVWQTKLCRRALEREITLPAETISLLQKTELLSNCITVADCTHHAPQRMGKDGPRHDYERDWGWVLRWGFMSVV